VIKPKEAAMDLVFCTAKKMKKAHSSLFDIFFYVVLAYANNHYTRTKLISIKGELKISIHKKK